MRGRPMKRTTRPRWRDTLAFRLGLVINTTLITVLASSAWIAHQRVSKMQIQHAMERLQEEAHVLRAAWTQFTEPVRFQRFVDQFCKQMTTAASPGHHIAVFDSEDRVIVRAHERPDPELESLMARPAPDQAKTFRFHGARFASVSLDIGKSARLAVAVSLAPVEEMLRIQGISRATTTAILVVIIFGVTALCLLIWVRDPLRGFVRVVSAVREHRFDQRVAPRGVTELRFLANGFNGMVDALRRAEDQRASEMKRARDIQRALVNTRSLEIEGFETEALYLPATSVGGDLLDIVPLRDGSTLMAIVDVTGHGVPGALCTALLRSSLRHASRSTVDLAEIVSGLNRELCDIQAAGVFATAVLVRVWPKRTTFEYVIAGHDPPVRVHPDGSVEHIEHGGLLLGVDSDASYRVDEAELPVGSRMFLFTDGLHEAVSSRGEQFGRARVAELFAGTCEMPLAEQLPAVVQRVRTFQDRADFDDDVTVLAIRSVSTNMSNRLTARDELVCG